jgi:ubiquinone/menaquinone biosynthesis C-methylase UbiE
MNGKNDGSMETFILVRQDENDNDNWWIEGRKLLFESQICAQVFGDKSKALEIGPGTGSNLGAFENNGYSEIYISDVDVAPLTYCIGKGYKSATIADASKLPYRDETFTSILAGDVLEHVPNDLAASFEIFRVLVTGSEAILTVPAFMILWSQHDDAAGHKRRYTILEFRDLLESAGFEILELYYFNWILFLPTLIIKKLLNLFSPGRYSDATSAPRYLNKGLTRLFLIDIWLAQRVRVPFGISIFAKVRKPS